MLTVSETNLRRAFEKSSKYFISHVPQQTQNKTGELDSDLYCRVYYYLFKKKMKKIKDNPNYYANILNITLIYTPPSPETYLYFPLKTLKYWVDVQWVQSFFMGRCLLSLGWPPFQRWCHEKIPMWGRSFTSTIFAPHLFLLGWLKLNLALLLDQLRLA